MSLTAETIAAAAKAAQGRGLPPVEAWDPPHCGDIGMRIARDGTWFYQGTPFTRPQLVRLFSTILRKDAEGYVLVTPVEKVSVEVEDVPFVAVDMTVAGDGPNQSLTFSTNLGDSATAGPDHPLRFSGPDDQGVYVPYILIRGGLEARIDRKTFYRLVDLATVSDDEKSFGVWSNGAFFAIAPTDQVFEN